MHTIRINSMSTMESMKQTQRIYSREQKLDVLKWCSLNGRNLYRTCQRFSLNTKTVLWWIKNQSAIYNSKKGRKREQLSVYLFLVRNEEFYQFLVSKSFYIRDAHEWRFPTIIPNSHYKHMCLTNKVKFYKCFYENYKRMRLITKLYGISELHTYYVTCKMYVWLPLNHSSNNTLWCSVHTLLFAHLYCIDHDNISICLASTWYVLVLTRHIQL